MGLTFHEILARYIKKYAMVTAPVADLPKKPSGSEKWTRDADVAFQKLKRAFAEPPILQYFDPEKPIMS